MKKDLITEINRVNELMGGKTLLSEQPIPKLLNLLFKTQSDDAVELIVRKSVKNADEAADILRRVKNGDELSKELAEKLLKDTDTMRLLANTLIDGTVLGVKFTNSIEKLVKDIVKDPKSYDKSIEIFSKKLDDASVMADWPDGLADEMMESIKKKVDDALKNKVDDVTKTLKLSPGEFEKFNKVVQSKTVKTFAGDIRKYWRKDVEAIKDDVIAYSEGFLDEIKGLKKNKEIQPLIDAYSVQISRLLDRAEIKMNGAAAKILEEAGVSKELVNKIKRGNEPFFVTYRKLRGKDNQTLTEIMSETSKEFLVEVRDLIRGIFRRKGNTLIRAINPKTSVGQWFYTNQWASLNKLYRLAIKMSPGQSQAKMLKYISATMFASSIGFVFGSLLKGGLLGLTQLYGGNLFNTVLSFVGGDDGLFFGKKVEDWKVELPSTGTGTEYLGELGKPLDAIGAVIYEDVYEGFKENGFKDVFLRVVPGGLLTYPESLAVKLFESATYGEGTVPNLRNYLLKMVGLDPQEVEDTLSELGTTETLPQDLINIIPDNKANELVIQDGNIYWGNSEYKVEKNPETNKWEVFVPGSGWYEITKDM